MAEGRLSISARRAAGRQRILATQSYCPGLIRYNEPIACILEGVVDLDAKYRTVLSSFVSDIERQAIGQLPAFVDDGLQIGAIRGLRTVCGRRQEPGRRAYWT